MKTLYTNTYYARISSLSSVYHEYTIINDFNGKMFSLNGANLKSYIYKGCDFHILFKLNPPDDSELFMNNNDLSNSRTVWINFNNMYMVYRLYRYYNSSNSMLILPKHFKKYFNDKDIISEDRCAISLKMPNEQIDIGPTINRSFMLRYFDE